MINTQAIRKRILLLALKGELVEQNPSDEPALYLVDRLCRENGLNAFVQNISEDEVPYEIPSSWVWCRLSDIGSTNIGLTYHPDDVSEDGVIVARSSNIINGKMDYSDLVKVSCGIRENQYLNNNDILICARNGSKALVGKCAIYEGESQTIAFGAFMAVFRTVLFRYVYYYFNTDVFKRNFISDDSKQINQVTQNILKQSLIPVPPLSEQERIIERIEAIFEVLDKIDVLQDQYASNQEVLKSKLIDAAIQGKLTERLAEDGDVEVTINKLLEGRKELVTNGEIRKKKVLSEIDEAEYPFDIPQSWKWLHISDVWAIINGDRGKNYPAKSTLSHEGIPFISALNLDGTTVVADDKLMCLSDEQYERLGSGKLRRGDVVVCIRGSLGKHGKYPFDKGAIASSLIIARNYIQNEAINDYLMVYLDSQLFRDEIEKYNGGSAQPNLAAESFEKFRVPFPPVSEQIRIVNKVNELLEKITE